MLQCKKKKERKKKKKSRRKLQLSYVVYKLLQFTYENKGTGT